MRGAVASAGTGWRGGYNGGFLGLGENGVKAERDMSLYFLPLL